MTDYEYRVLENINGKWIQVSSPNRQIKYYKTYNGAKKWINSIIKKWHIANNDRYRYYQYYQYINKPKPEFKIQRRPINDWEDFET